MKTIDLNERVIEDSKEIEEILCSAKIGRLCFCLDAKPFVIPVNFAYNNRTIYVHGSSVSLKTESVHEHPEVCFEVDEFIDTVPASVPCEYDTEYRNVVAYGSAKVVANLDEKVLALRLIVTKYASKETAIALTRPMVEQYRSSRGRETVVLKIQVQKLVGRHSIKDVERATSE